MQKQSKDVKHKPSQTAQGTAFSRALAAKEFKHGIWGQDHLAENFLGPGFIALLGDPKNLQFVKKKFMPPGMYNYLIARTVFFDDVFKKALDDNYPQIVFLGAGYDSRTYRFQKLIKETRIFELDIHTTQERKKECLFKAGINIPDQLVFVPIDFNTNSLKNVLVDAGFDKNQETFFIWEGVTFYLHPEDIDNTLDFIRLNSPPGSTIAFDYSRFSRDKKDKYGVRETVGFMKSAYSGEPTFFKIDKGKIESFLSERGFKIAEHHTARDIEKNFLTSNKGVFLGQIPSLFCFCLASVSS